MFRYPAAIFREVFRKKEQKPNTRNQVLHRLYCNDYNIKILRIDTHKITILWYQIRSYTQYAYKQLSRSYVIQRDLVQMEHVKCIVSGGVTYLD